MQLISHFASHWPTPAVPDRRKPRLRLGFRHFGDTLDLSRGLQDFLRFAEMGARLQNRDDSVRPV
jgi:hypothetical protein